MRRAYYGLILVLAVMVLVTVGISVWRPSVPDLSPLPDIEIAEYEPPELELTGVEVIDRAIEFGVRSAAVQAALEGVFFQVLNETDDVTLAMQEVINATRSVEYVVEQYRIAEILYLHNAIDEVREEVNAYRINITEEAKASRGFSWPEGLALFFAGVQALIATIGLLQSRARG